MKENYIQGTEINLFNVDFLDVDKKIDELDLETVNNRVAYIKSELQNYAKQNKLQNIEDRVQRGLSTIGMLAIFEIRILVEELVKKNDAVLNNNNNKEGVEDIVLAIQNNGPWKYTDEITKDNPIPEIKIWMIMNAISSIDIKKEKDLNKFEFLKHIEHIKILLQEAIKNPDLFFESAKDENLKNSYQQLRYEDGIPISEMDIGFIPIALQGYEAGIIQDADGTLFIGAKHSINQEIFEHWGLVMREEIDGRGRKIKTYYNKNGQKLFRQLYPGFIIIDAKKFDIATSIVRAIERLSEGVLVEDLEIPNEEVLAITMYVPSSTNEASQEEEWRRMEFLRNIENSMPMQNTNTTDLIQIRGPYFYESIKWIKSHVIAIDTLETLEKKKKLKGQSLPTDKEKKDLYNKVSQKVEQKIEELKYLMSVIEPELEKIKLSETTIIDMAGGAGDLGLTVGLNLLARGQNLKEIQIVDPFSKYASLDMFTEFIIDHLPMKEQLRKLVEHTNQSIQESEITSDAIVVAKHPCGDLADSIIEKWVRSESPLLVIMTCCQDKACGLPSRYNISQTDWNQWTRESSRTNVELPDKSDKNYEKMKKKLEEGKEAMTKLDNARVDYLNRHGFEAVLFQTEQFPKGDVIVARRKKNNNNK